MGVIAVAAGIFAAMVLYTVSLMHQYEIRILTGELPVAALEAQ